MKAVFADTFLLGGVNQSRRHTLSRRGRLRRLSHGRNIFSTDEVLVEFMTFFSADPRQRGRAAATVRRLLTNPAIRVVEQSRDSFLGGLGLYQSRPDKGYSLQEGFRALFR